MKGLVKVNIMGSEGPAILYPGEDGVTRLATVTSGHWVVTKVAEEDGILTIAPDTGKLTLPVEVETVLNRLYMGPLMEYLEEVKVSINAGRKS